MRTIAETLLAVLVLSALVACGSGKRSLDTGGLFPIVQNEKCGYIDKSGKVVIEPQFKFCTFFFEGLACVTDGQKFGYIDKTGNFAINPQYEQAFPFAEGLAAVWIGQKLGFIDRTGGLVITPQFNADVVWFSEGLAGVRSGAKCGYIDKTGKYVINPQFDDCPPFLEKLAAVRVENKWGYVDPGGRVVITAQFDQALRFTEGLGLVRIGSKYGYIDKTGKFVINPQFDVATPFSSDGFAGVRVGDKWGGIDKTGKMVINPQFDGNYMTRGGLGRLGNILDILYRDISRVTFSDGLASVLSGDKFGYIDKTGKYVINPQFDDAFLFVDGLALVAEGRGPGAKIGWIDKTGKYVWKSSDNSATGQVIKTHDAIYVSDYQGNGIFEVDPQTGEIAKNLKIANLFNATHLAWNQPREELYVIDQNGVPPSVPILKLNPLRQIDTITEGVSHNTEWIVVGPSGDKIYLVCTQGGASAPSFLRIVIVDAINRHVVNTISLKNEYGSAFLSLSPDEKRLYVSWDNHVDAYDTSNLSLVKRNDFPGWTSSFPTVSPDGLHLYIIQNGNLIKLSTDSLSIERQLALRDVVPHEMKISKDGRNLWVGVWQRIYEVPETLTTYRSFELSKPSSNPHALPYFDTDDTEQHLYVAAMENSTIEVIELSTGKVIQFLKGPQFAGDLIVLPQE